ncbi:MULTISPECIES: hypothetical protein [Legionella]|uniref:Uncharacterized protein n=3 Tax=Legionella septentrionalis TaxID=2498109 RepID=A0A3S1CL14_9GAMM|nr:MULTISPECIES: hypothetical protein [Legionella]MCP0913350.1 hypothetical protein [Legionella sp. 27cVA30]RUQ85074.1 hypothetical protein EKM59_07565 [Legionella septentrionalis]RUR08630.1 hypothetical protein ELY14_10980 [Legionella septentrionalis]
MKSIGTLFGESRLLAKSIDRINISPEQIDFAGWNAEAKLLCSMQGSCLSSATLLVKGKYVPTYGINGRCYGFLFNAEQCFIYDVSSKDSNSNRITKLEKRKLNKGIDLLAKNELGLKTLDELSTEIQLQDPKELNEVLLDSWKHSCVGLYVRYLESTQDQKHFYTSLLEIRLIQKYLIQKFSFPTDFPICLYNEKLGKLMRFPADTELKLYARMQGIHAKTQPKLFDLLSDEYQFSLEPSPLTVEAYLKHHEMAREFTPELINKMLRKLTSLFIPFDGRKVDVTSIGKESVDSVSGIAKEQIENIIQDYMANTPKHSPLLAKESFFKFKTELGSPILAGQQEIAFENLKYTSQ